MPFAFVTRTAFLYSLCSDCPTACLFFFFIIKNTDAVIPIIAMMIRPILPNRPNRIRARKIRVPGGAKAKKPVARRIAIFLGDNFTI